MKQFLSRLFQQLLPAPCLLCHALKESQLCNECLSSIHKPLELQQCPKLESLDEIYALFPYRDGIKSMLHHIKFEDHRQLGEKIGDFLEKVPIKGIPYADIVIPVPVDATRLKRRGFNQVTLLMKPFIEAHNLGEWHEACFRAKQTEALHGLSKQNRKQEVENAFWIDPCLETEGKIVMILDDILTTGATLSEIARVLKAKGASKIIGLTYAYTPLNRD